MTKEELEKEVTEYLNTQTLPKMDSLVYRVIKNLIFGFAEPREKRIAELKAQIEGMKRYLDCEYCEHYTQPYDCKNCNEETRSDWKLKEIKEK